METLDQEDELMIDSQEAHEPEAESEIVLREDGKSANDQNAIDDGVELRDCRQNAPASSRNMIELTKLSEEDVTQYCTYMQLPEDDLELELAFDMSGEQFNIAPILNPLGTENQYREYQYLDQEDSSILNETFWNNFKREVRIFGRRNALAGTSNQPSSANEKKFEQSKKLLAEIRRRMVDILLPHQVAVKHNIMDKLDPNFISDQCELDLLDLRTIAKCLFHPISVICESRRRSKLDDLYILTDVVELYRGLVKLLDKIKSDFNAMVMSQYNRYMVLDQSQDYNYSMFQKILKQNQLTTTNTQGWLARVVDRLDKRYGIETIVKFSQTSEKKDGRPNAKRGPLGTGDRSDWLEKVMNSDVIAKVLNVAYCDLLDEDSHFIDRNFPETLEFDRPTIKRFRRQFKYLVTISSILLTSFAFINELSIPVSKEFEVSFKNHVILLLASTDNNIHDRLLNTFGLVCDSPIRDEYDSDTNNSNNYQEDDKNLTTPKLQAILMQLLADIEFELSVGRHDSLFRTIRSQIKTLRGKIMELRNPENPVRRIVKRRLLEFVELLLNHDAKYNQCGTCSRIPTVNMPLGLNCLAKELTLTMSKIVKAVRYNKDEFNELYEKIIVDTICEKTEHHRSGGSKRRRLT